ncbi:hypothetical protein E4T50_14304 [Aureobasidium sp. EXF-12298]|nr:hypothetical protein E4T50_14304 [Aureobasidium sp. EXF-12298]KAI4752075.1 hypothetical protein E4T51_14741 [Aureobasidium sp. EXF-12344]KAI4769349.1 hypothetical protein E4T52_15600 [Aureobasidium sp. EXF-3400]
MSSDVASRPQKRVRLSRACNKCRSRKVRCDERQPSCSNCVRAGVECITTDPNHPDQVTTFARRRAGTAPATQSGVSAQSLSSDRVNPAVDSVERNADASQIPVWQLGTSPNSGLNGISGSRMEISGLVRRSDPQNGQPIVESSIQSGVMDNVQSPGFAVNSVSATERKYLGSTSLQVFSQWLDMTFHIAPTGLTSSFQHGMRFCEEMDLPPDLYMPSIPTAWQEYLAAFCLGVGVLFPIVSVEDITSSIQYMSQQDLKKLPVRQRPLIATVYACLAIGADSLGHTNQGLDLVTAAYSLYAYLVAQPYVTSAQALLLICLALRGRNKDGAGSQALGQAIRILHTLGLHRKLNGYGKLDPEQTESLRLGIQIWWGAYCLDRIMSLETGRPPQVQDEDIDQSRDLQTTGVQDLAPLQALLDLASIQGSVCRHLCTPRLPTIREVLEAQSSLDRALIEWQNNLPAQLRCDGDITINGSNLALSRAFLSIQFHTTMINLHRAALLMDKEIHQTNLARYDLCKTNAGRLASSESICANSARAIITAFLQARDITDHSRLQTMTGPLMAIYVLSISTLKNATSWSARSDLGLIYSAAEAVEQRYTADGQDPGFYTLLKTLKQFASRDTLSPNGLASSRAPTRRTSPQANQSHIALPGGSASRDHDLGAPHLGHEQDPNLSDEWNLLFPRLYVGDFALDTGAFEGMDIEHLMGIPHLSFDEPH